MKKISFLMFLLVCSAISMYADELRYDGGGSITKRLKLTINETAIDSNAYIQWELKGDWDKFEYGFTQGNLDKKAKTFTVYAKDYLKSINGEEGILLTISGRKKTPSGNYILAMEVAKATDNMVVNKDKMNLNLTVNYEGHKKTILEILLPFIIALIVILLILLVLHVTAKFPEGLLQLGREEVELKGRKRISVRKELEDRGINVAGEMDVVLVKKRFVPYQGPTIKEVKGCELRRIDGSILASGEIIYPEETIYGLKDKNGEDIVIRQC